MEHVYVKGLPKVLSDHGPLEQKKLCHHEIRDLFYVLAPLFNNVYMYVCSPNCQYKVN